MFLQSILADQPSVVHPQPPGSPGKTEQQKLDESLGSVRQTEQRVQRHEDRVDVPKPKIDGKFLQLNNQPGNGQARFARERRPAPPSG